MPCLNWLGISHSNVGEKMVFRRKSVSSFGAIAAIALVSGFATGCSLLSSAAEPERVITLPDEVSDELAVAIDAACRAGFMNENPWQDLTLIPESLSKPIIVTARGDWAAAMYLHAQGGIATCMVSLASTDVPVAATWTARGEGWPQSGGFSNWALGAVSWNGTFTVNPIITTAQMPANKVVVTTWDNLRLSNQTQETREFFGMPQEDKVFDPPASIYGRVGSDVTNLVLHTFYDGDVVATIHDGWFAALVHGQFGNGICSTSTDPDGNTEELGCDPFSTATVSLLDGTTYEVPLDDIRGSIMEQLPSDTVD